MENQRMADFIAIIVLSGLLMLTCLISNERQIATDSIEPCIRTEVALQMKQRNIPTVHGKYVYVIDGKEILVEAK